MYLGDFEAANQFDVNTIHSVSVAEFERRCQQKNVDTNSNLPAPEKETLDIFFRREEIEITYETYGDIEQYADAALSDISEEYADDAPKYGVLSELERFDLGEPIQEPGKEVSEDETETAETSRAVECEGCRYTVPDGNVQHIEGLGAVAVEKAVVQGAEHYVEAIPDDYLRDADAFGFGYEEDYFD